MPSSPANCGTCRQYRPVGVPAHPSWAWAWCPLLRSLAAIGLDANTTLAVVGFRWMADGTGNYVAGCDHYAARPHGD